MDRSRTNEQGWALVSVLLVVASLALFAAAAQTTVLTSFRAQSVAWERARLDAALDSAISETVFSLINAADLPRDGTSRDVDLNGRKLRIAVQDERGRIDLNAADVSVLKALLTSAGLNDNSAGEFAGRITDWRIAPADGSPANQHSQFRPRHGPFQSVDELRLVPGITDEIFRQIAPALTVYSGLPAVDPAIAPREVMAILTGQNTSAPVSGTNGAQIPVAGRSFSISVAAQNRHATRTAIVLLTGDDTRPYIVLAWR